MVSDDRFHSTENMVGALKELKIPIAKDQANGSPIGGYFCPHNQDPVTETRSSAREAYYNNFTKRQNLHLLTGQQVTRIVTQKISGAVKVTDVEVRAATHLTHLGK